MRSVRESAKKDKRLTEFSSEIHVISAFVVKVDCICSQPSCDSDSSQSENGGPAIHNGGWGGKQLYKRCQLKHQYGVDRGIAPSDPALPIIFNVLDPDIEGYAEGKAVDPMGQFGQPSASSAGTNSQDEVSYDSV